MVRVVLLEQDEVMQVFLSRYLRRKGYEVEIESPEYLQPGRIERSLPDLLIAHLRGPRDHEWLTLVARAAKQLEVPVLVIVAAFRPELKALCDALDFRALLAMPFGGSELEEAIRDLLEREEST